MESFWFSLEKSDIYKNWGWFSNFFEKPGIFDNSPMRHVLTNLINYHKIKRHFVFGATNLTSMKYERFR